MVDGLEHRGLVERRVADYDRRIKTVELTDEGVAARERALDAVYGPGAGLAALSPTERATLARLLRKMADAQASYDEELLDKPQVRADMRRLAQQRIREFGGGWSRRWTRSCPGRHARLAGAARTPPRRAVAAQR